MIRKTWFSLFVLVVTVVCASSQAGFFWRTKEARRRPVIRPQSMPHFHPTFGYHQTQWRQFPAAHYSEIVTEPATVVPGRFDPDGTAPPADPAPVQPGPSESVAPPEPADAIDPAVPAEPAKDLVEPVKQEEAPTASDQPTALRPRIPLPPAPPATVRPEQPRVRATPVSTPWRSLSARLPHVRPGS